MSVDEHLGPSAPVSKPPEGGGETVLICDDEVRLAALTAGLLEDCGFRSLTAAAGDEALSVIAAPGSAVRLLLLDVNLGSGPSAREVLEGVRRARPIPVILTSGFAREDVPKDLLSHPLVFTYIGKPYTVDELVAAISGALAKQRGEHDGKQETRG